MSIAPNLSVKASITASYTLDDNLLVYGDNTYLYNEDGYLKTKTTPDGSTTYSYGTMGELLSVITPTQNITYQQNANNQRVAKLIDGIVVEKYLWANLTTLLAIYDKDDNLVQRFEYADSRMPVAMTQGADKYYLHYDQVGSLRAVSRVLSHDNTLEVIKEIVYDTYGNIISDSNEAFKIPFGFAGGLYDVDTKLTRFGYRDYDGFTGKWTAKDPIGFAGGDSNLYGYVLGDPVNLVDPTGLFDMDAIAGTLSATVAMYELIYWGITPIMYDYYLDIERDKAVYDIKMNCEYTDEEKDELIRAIDKYILELKKRSLRGRLVP